MSRRKTSTDTSRSDRRGFLKGAAAVGGGAAVSLLMPAAARAATNEPAATPVGEAKQTGYRLTEHVARYYQTLKS